MNKSEETILKKQLICFENQEIRKIAEVLSRHDNKFNNPYSSDVKSFIKEVLSEQQKKQITPLRATRLSIDIASFYFSNRIKMEKPIQDFLKKINTEIKSDLARIFYTTAHDVLEFIKTLPKRHFLKTEVYFCKKDIFDAIITIKKEYEKNLTSSYEKRYFGFKNILNILNEKGPCFDYSVSYIERSKIITEEKSVHKYIGGEFFAWKNKLIADTEEYIKIHLTKEIDIQRKRLELKKKIAKAEDEYNFLVSYLEKQITKKEDEQQDKNINIRIISYKDAELYPKIKISLRGSSNSKHLRSTVPNLLWFEPQIAREDMEVDAFIKKAKNPFGYVYYIEHA